MSLGATDRIPDAYTEVIHVPPSPSEVEKAITYITHLLATSKLLNETENVEFDGAIVISRRAIGYINSYEDHIKKQISDMQTFLNTLLQSPKYKNKPKNRIVQEAEKVFLNEKFSGPRVPKSAPITIQRQTMPDASFTPESGEFCLVACSPSPGKNISVFSQLTPSSPQAQTTFAIFMESAIPWGTPVQSKELVPPIQ